MNAFYLIAIILGLTLQNVTKKHYNGKTNGGGVYVFSMLTSLAAAIFFIVTGKNFEWNTAFLLYSFGFALSYAATTVFNVLAIREGSLSLTSLVISYSLMIPALYGILFLKETITLWLIPGILLLAISLILINEKNGNCKISFKWILFAFFAFIGNGMCTVLQKAEQLTFNGNYKNEFMIVALLMCTAFMAVGAFIWERKSFKFYLKKGTGVSFINGIINGMVNLFVMILSAMMPVSIMFPLISAGGIVVTYFISRFFYKEKLSRKQFIGFLLGIGSVICLNL